MSDLDALLAGIVAEPSDALRWLVMADWLEDHGQPERAELVRVHRELLRTCTATRETKARKQLHARMMELMRAGVQPCLPTRTITLPGGVEMRFSFIPPGSFLMGSPEDEAERNANERQHRVTLTKGFWMGQTPVTKRHWAAIRDDPEYGFEQGFFQGEDLPVEGVNWNFAWSICEHVKRKAGLDVRMPTEAEWEFAARAGTTTPFYWGGELNGTQANCNGHDPYGTEIIGRCLFETTTVGCYADVSPHPWGVLDVVGNVWEWCQDWFGDYPSADATDPTGSQSGSGRICRGGSHTEKAATCRSAMRLCGDMDDLYTDRGFRLAADLSALA